MSHIVNDQIIDNLRDELKESTYYTRPPKDYRMTREELELRLLDIEDDLYEEAKRRKTELGGIVDSLSRVLYEPNV